MGTLKGHSTDQLDENDNIEEINAYGRSHPILFRVVVEIETIIAAAVRHTMPTTDHKGVAVAFVESEAKVSHSFSSSGGSKGSPLHLTMNEVTLGGRTNLSRDGSHQRLLNSVQSRNVPGIVIEDAVLVLQEF